MSPRAIDRKDWPAFAEAFSRRHDGWLVSVEVDEDGSHRRIATDIPLRGVVAELGDSPGSFMIFTGFPQPHVAHFIEHPASLSVDETPESGETELVISDEGGSRTRIVFRSPVRPDTVDGIA